jgi:hypothetical protein
MAFLFLASVDESVGEYGSTMAVCNVQPDQIVNVRQGSFVVVREGGSDINT